MPLIFLRHPRPDGGNGRCYGRTDLAPAAGWETEIDAALAALPAIERIVTSPLARCATAAQRIAAARGLAVETDPDLAEMDFGRWEMLPWDAVPRADLDAWAADLLHARPHGGETVAELRARTARALARTNTRPTLWVGHAGVYKALLSLRGAPDAWDARIGYCETVALP